MDVQDIIDAARESNPSLEIVVDGTEGEEQTLVLRNVMLMKKAERKTLFGKLRELTNPEGETDADQVAYTAEISKGFLQQVADDKTAFKALEKQFKASGIEEAAWTQLFLQYQDVTQLGEAVSSQTS